MIAVPGLLSLMQALLLNLDDKGSPDGKLKSVGVEHPS